MTPHEEENRMIEQTITYDGFDDEPVTETWWFHQTKAELVEKAISMGGDPEDIGSVLRKMIGDGDRPGQLKFFKEFIVAAVGKRSEDGKRFMKNDDIREEFVQTGAFSAFFMKLVLGQIDMVEFIFGCLPKDLVGEVRKMSEKEPLLAQHLQATEQTINLPDHIVVDDQRPAWLRESRAPTTKEMLEMSPEEFALAKRHALTLGVTS
jgi:hypothetical protein